MPSARVRSCMAPPWSSNWPDGVHVSRLHTAGGNSLGRSVLGLLAYLTAPNTGLRQTLRTRSLGSRALAAQPKR